MTSDIVQNKYISKKDNISAQETSRNILSFFKKSPDSVVISRDKTELLKIAYKMLSQAERQIAEQNNRIKELEKLSTIDDLTGLTNRRGFYKSFKREMGLTNRGNNQGGLLIMIDLDYFKSINDKFGHQAGDKALKKVAVFLRSTVRNMDIAARLGGDEFIILFPNTNIAKSMRRAQELEKELNELSFKWEDKVIKIQASLGVKEYKKGDIIESIIENADSHMYENKSINR